MKTVKGTSHQKQLLRLKRLAGQVQGVVRMVEEQRYCVDILTQIKAIQSALAGVERQIVEEHLRHCVAKAVSSSDSARAQEVITEMIDVLKSSKGAR